MSTKLANILGEHLSDEVSIDMESIRLNETEHFAEVAAAEMDLESAFRDYDQVMDSFQTLSLVCDDLESRDGGISADYVAGVNPFIAASTVDGKTFDMEGLSDGTSTFDMEEKEGMLSKLADNLKKFWNYLKNQAVKLIASVTDFFSSIFQGWEKLGKRAEAAAEKLKAGAKEGKVKVSGAVKVQIGNKYDDKVAEMGLTRIEAEFATVEQMVEMLTTLNEIKVDAMIKDTKDAKTAEEAKSAMSKFTDLAAKTWSKVKGLLNKKTEKDNKSFASYKTMELPGGRVYSLTHEQGTEGEPDKVIEEFSAAYQLPSIDFKADETKIKNAVEIDALSSSFADKLVKAIAEGTKVSKDLNDTLKDIKANSEARTKAWDAAIAEADKGTIGTFWTKSRVRTMSYMVAREQSRQLTRYVSYMYSTLRTYVAHVEASAK